MIPRALHRFAVLTAVATLGLVGVGGLVTSHGVGMAVPDWPNTYGYNMFFFPVSRWVGGIFYEHSHRLFASGVGLFTTILALWLYGKSAQPLLRWGGLFLALLGLLTVLIVPRHWADGVVSGVTGIIAFSASWFWPRCEPSPKWLRRLGVLAFFGVVFQGVLGGLRVVLFKDQLGIFHATLAQLFFVLICLLAVFTSPFWQRRNWKATGQKREAGEADMATVSPGEPQLHGVVGRLAPLFLITTFLILCQLILGATMRHQHAGLAIPDFPLAYGKLWPAVDPGSVQIYNQHRIEVTAANPITAFQIELQMVHRILAGLILVAVASCAFAARNRSGKKASLSKPALIWLAFVLIQGLLGAATIWSNKAADIATLHVLTGAITLALGAILTSVAYRDRKSVLNYKQLLAFTPSGALGGFEPRPSTAGQTR
ncbi:MAG TPA: COX15/CtaA family protein [Candidatus Limnocylindrales bacterium]|nr:COX15/CtaA family protein [Candidatus Limnocylindrales bacterium]